MVFIYNISNKVKISIKVKITYPHSRTVSRSLCVALISSATQQRSMWCPTAYLSVTWSLCNWTIHNCYTLKKCFWLTVFLSDIYNICMFEEQISLVWVDTDCVINLVTQNCLIAVAQAFGIVPMWACTWKMFSYAYLVFQCYSFLTELIA